MFVDVFLFVVALLKLTVAARFGLVASSITSTDDRLTIAEFDFDDTTGGAIESEDISRLKDAELYCFHIRENSESLSPCFMMLEWNSTLPYKLTYNLDTRLYSLHLNEDNESSVGKSMVFEKEHASTAELADITPLKKITKTYADKKKDAKNVLIDDDKNDIKESDKSWLEANWKKILIGVVLYNLVIAGMKGTTTDSKATKKD